MTKTIAILQLKGGAGRSTLSTTLAGELSKQGKTVLVDCDMPQGTSASWFALRQQEGKQAGLSLETAATHTELAQKVQRHPDAKFIVIDGPPRIAEMTRASLILADLVLIPTGASAADLWATGDLLGLIEEAKAIKTLKTRLVWTRFRAATKAAQELSKVSEGELGIEALKTAMGLRVAYAEALGSGQTVAELSDQTARAECSALIQEITDLTRTS